MRIRISADTIRQAQKLFSEGLSDAEVSYALSIGKTTARRIRVGILKEDQGVVQIQHQNVRISFY